MVHDINIQHDVVEELECAPDVDASRIGVSVQDGVVALAGHVATLEEKMRAEQLARRVEGVRAIANDLQVVIVPELCRDDAALAAAAADVLANDPNIARDRIDITVSNGWITLDGEVDAEWQRSEVEDAIRGIIGLRGMTSSIEAKPRVLTQEDIMMEIQKPEAKGITTAPAPAEPENHEDRIRLRAYQLFLERNGEPGHADDDWFRAEAEMRPRLTTSS